MCRTKNSYVVINPITNYEHNEYDALELEASHQNNTTMELVKPAEKIKKVNKPNYNGSPMLESHASKHSDQQQT